MIEVFRKMWSNPMAVIKGVGALILLLLVLSLGSQLIVKTMQSFGLGEGLNPMGTASFGSKMAYDEDVAQEAMMGRGMAPATSPMPPSDGGNFTGGDDAEDFEVTEYNAEYKVHNKEDVCVKVSGLKSQTFVLFESANEYDTGCSFSFKVQNDNAQEILSILQDLDPENLSANTYTIKRSIDSITNEKEILEQKLESINETLETSLTAYDQITDIATRERDAESLATIIDSKVRLIERLTQERISIHEQLNRLERNGNDQMDRLDYTYFYVSVWEDKFIDGDRIRDSWKEAIQSFVHDTNAIVQGITIGMIIFLLYAVQYIFYFFILLCIAKYGWKYAKQLWNR